MEEPDAGPGGPAVLGHVGQCLGHGEVGGGLGGRRQADGQVEVQVDRDRAQQRHRLDRAGADWKPLVVPAQDVSYTGFDLKVAVLADLVHAGRAPDFASWQRLARLVADAARGDASGFAGLLGQSAVGSAKAPSFVGMNATRCPDGWGFADYTEFQRIRALGERISPHFAGVQLWHPLGCTGWPAPVSNPPAALPGDRPRPFLGAGTWTDHAETAVLVTRVPGSSTVRYDGPGHGLYRTGDRCTIAHANRYLAFLRLPPPATVCRPPT